MKSSIGSIMTRSWTGRTGRIDCLELMTIEEVKATALIYRVKFDAFFGDPPQVINLRICARPRLRSLESNEVMPAAWRIARLPLS